LKTLINRAIAWTENLTVLEGHGEVLNDGCRGYRVEELKKKNQVHRLKPFRISMVPWQCFKGICENLPVDGIRGLKDWLKLFTD
jgi:hypothetical protein